MSLSSNTAHPVSTFVSINNRDMRLIDFMEAFPEKQVERIQSEAWCCLPSLRMYTALLEEGQGMLRVQTLSLQAESQG